MRKPELMMLSIDYHEQVVEQEDFSLVNATPLTSVWIWNLEQLTAAHQPAVRHGEHLPHTHSQIPVKVPHDVASAQGCRETSYRLLANNHPLHSLDLRDVVIVGPQLPFLDPSIDGHQKVSGDVLTVINPWWRHTGRA